MLIKLVFFLSVTLAKSTDTLKYPIFLGNVDTTQKSIGFHDKTDLEILPTSSFEVKSCSKGKVLYAITVALLLRKIIVIQTDSILYRYILDSSTINKGDLIEEGEIIGKIDTAANRHSERGSLYFSVSSINGHPYNSRRFLKYKK